MRKKEKAYANSNIKKWRKTKRIWDFQGKSEEISPRELKKMETLKPLKLDHKMGKCRREKEREKKRRRRRKKKEEKLEFLFNADMKEDFKYMVQLY